MPKPSRARAILMAGASAAMMVAACASWAFAPAASPQSLDLGRDAAGEPCTAARWWRDPVPAGLFDTSFAITCRTVTASRSLGLVRVTGDRARAAAVEATLDCGAPTAAILPGVGTVQARRCFDRTLSADTVTLSVARDGRTVIGSAVPSVLGPLQRAVRRLAGDANDAAPLAAIDVAALAVPPAARPAAQSTARSTASLPSRPTPGRAEISADASASAIPSDFDPAQALRQGVTLNHRGLHEEASRLLNDAVSRLGPETSPAVSAELSLEAGLADSNISFAEAADAHFRRADALIDAGAGARSAFLLRKRDSYRVLHLLNQRRFRDALDVLGRRAASSSTASPLSDPAVVQALNAGGTAGFGRAVAVPDVGNLYQLLLDVQLQWARSVASMALGDAAAASDALKAADLAFAQFRSARVDGRSVLWLQAKLDRQRGRLQAARGEWTQAVRSFDGAIDALSLGAASSGGTGNEPVVAGARLERAAVIARQGAPADVVRRAYAQAVDALIASGATGGAAPVGLGPYLDLLVADAAGPAGGAAPDLFFRALQAAGEPAISRQLSRMQGVVAADPAVGARLRERAEVERTLTRLRYSISDEGSQEGASKDGDPKQDPAELERQRRAAQNRLLALDAALGSDARLGAVSDRPASLAEVRAALAPGEAYLKLAQIDGAVYGAVIAADGARIYRVEAPAADLATISARVRASIDGGLEDGQLRPFDVAASYTLFRLLAGPAADRIGRATALVVDPAGPLERLPAGVLVTDRESVDTHALNADPFDYSRVSFLAAKTELSTAVSPRSFLLTRNLRASNAPKPFIGFAEHRVPVRGPKFASARIGVGNVCSAEFSALRDLAARASPIDRREVAIAATALGVPGAEIVAGEGFSDTAVKARADLGQYAVLHFATHGLEEGVWGCDKSPPALVTSFGDAASDGLLSFDEIAELRLNANLVVLSACDTGSGIRSQQLARRSGQEEAGSTLQGLVRAFLAANARAVMATHWEVPAVDGTYAFTQNFYSAARWNSIGGALRTAQRGLIATPATSHPFYWGAYFVVGDSSKRMLGR